MSTRIPWFERRWTFGFPIENRADLIERLRGTPARLEEYVGDVDAERATLHTDDAWSIHDNVGHLLDLEPLWAGRTDDILAGTETLRPADLTNRATHEANHDATPLPALLAGFRAARAAWVARLDGLDAATFAAAGLHPRLNEPMRLIDVCVFVADHDDHHLARIRHLLRTP